MKSLDVTGLSLYVAIQQAQEYSKQSPITDVEIVVNGIELTVSPYSFEDDIVTIYHLKRKLRPLSVEPLGI